MTDTSAIEHRSSSGRRRDVAARSADVQSVVLVVLVVVVTNGASAHESRPPRCRTVAVERSVRCRRPGWSTDRSGSACARPRSRRTAITRTDPGKSSRPEHAIGNRVGDLASALAAFIGFRAGEALRDKSMSSLIDWMFFFLHLKKLRPAYRDSLCPRPCTLAVQLRSRSTVDRAPEEIVYQSIGGSIRGARRCSARYAGPAAAIVIAEQPAPSFALSSQHDPTFAPQAGGGATQNVGKNCRR